jgi:hypothetical protein
MYLPPRAKNNFFSAADLHGSGRIKSEGIQSLWMTLRLFILADLLSAFAP